MKVVRYSGKPTSGRYVYLAAGGWWWQCDLHDEYTDDDGTDGGPHRSMLEAFGEARRHAAECGLTNDV